MPTILGHSNDDQDFYLLNGVVDTNPGARGFDGTIALTCLSRRVQAGTAEIFRGYLTDQCWGGAARSDIRINWFTRIDCPGTVHGMGDVILIFDIVGGRPLFRISRQEQTTNNNYSLWYHNGTTWVLVGATAPIPFNTTMFMTLTIKMADSGGILQWHVNGALFAELTGDTKFTASTTFDCVQFWTPGGGGSGWGTHVDVTEIQMASFDYMTYGLRVVSGQMNAAGTNSGQVSGVYTDVDDLTLNTGDGITFDTAAQKATFNFTNLPAIVATAPVMNVRVSVNARRGASGPQQLRVLLQQAAGLSQSTILAINGIGFTTLAANFPTDFSGNAFSATVYNASEAGAQAET